MEFVTLNKNTKSNAKIIFYAGIFSLIYFIILIVLSYYQVEIQLVNIIGEMITIPLLLFLLFSLVYSIINVVKGVRSKLIFSILSLSTITIILLIVVTIVQLDN